MIIEIPEKVRHILSVLNSAGFEAYAVGGCVRDAILHRIPGDWDITTNAKPEQVKHLFPRTIDTGIQHGTVTVMMHGEGFEVTTYRIDGDYLDGRHPKEVFYTTELREDLRRRDFTMNAMAYHPEQGVVDIFGGQEDMKAGVIRCVGDPLERFSEDALRILRGVRFAAQLGFTIEQGTKAALPVLAPNLRKVSRERIQVEMVKLLVSPHPGQLCFLYRSKVLQEILPELVPVMEAGLGERIDAALSRVPPHKELRLAVMLSACPEQARHILQSLKLDHDTMRGVELLTKWKDSPIPESGAQARQLLCSIGEKYYLALMDLKDGLAEDSDETHRRSAAARALYRQVAEAGDCYCLKQLAVNGKDLMEAGCAGGKVLGDTLNRLLQWVLEDPSRNTKEQLLAKFRNE